MTNGLAEFMREHGLVLRICNGAVTFCDGDCENCECVKCGCEGDFDERE